MIVVKQIIRVLLYFSIAFVAYYLFKVDYVALKQLSFQCTTLILSILLVFLGFYVSALSWKQALRVHDVYINNKLAVYSHGISIFGKYMPGKIWVILGRASIVSEKGISLLKLSAISLKEQLVFLLVGLIISIIIIPFIKVYSAVYAILLITIIVLSLFLFSHWVYERVLHLIEIVFKKRLSIPFVGFKTLLPISFYVFVNWLLWSFSFGLLCKAFFSEIPLVSSFIFPISACYGLLAVVMPGGIGVREGIIVFFLSAIGVSPQIATTLSIIQRLWFVSGELFIFLIALTGRYINQD